MRSTTTSSEETRLHPLTLAFASADLERRFWSERNRKTIGASRLTLVLGVGIYAVFGLLDRSVMLDIDHFKQINDTHGHAAGDRVLQVVASTLRRQLRPGDFVCRYGGEEFLALLPDTNAGDSFAIGDRLRSAILEASLEAWPEPIEVTASVGSAALGPESTAGLGNLLRKADGALYGAKRAGRNVVVRAA